jgi:hypothetical protein
MVKTSFLQTYDALKAQPTPAKELVLSVMQLSGRKESSIRKWLDGSTRPDEATIAKIEDGMKMPFDTLIVEYYRRRKLPTAASSFRRRIKNITHKSEITVARYVQGIIVPDRLTQTVIAQELNTPVQILFPKL